jgi:predicted N-acetyltransferase YhbS
MHLRTMTTKDVSAGLTLNRNAGWNQTAADWEYFLQASPDGCFVAELDGQVCGTVATISFENRFAWIGMVLVDPKHRSKGIGTRLLEAAIRHLDDRKIPTIKLDATPQGKPLYEKLGFVSAYEIERWTLRRTTPGPLAGAVQESTAAISLAMLEPIFQIDREVFGADRSRLLKSLHGDAPEFTIVNCRGGAPVGYAFGRRGLFADHLGPWMAKDLLSAQHLLEVFLARSTRETLVVDCLKSRDLVSRLLTSRGFTYTRPLTRMYRGPNTYPGQPEVLCAILGPEFG